MRILKQKKGIGLPAVLGIVAFVLGTTATFLSYVFFQARLTDRVIEQNELYANAIADVRGALYLIARDKNLSPEYLRELEELLNVTITPLGDTLFTITSKTLVNNKPVTSYLSGSIRTVDTFDTIFQYTGEEPTFVLSPLVTPSNLASSFLPTYIQNNFPSITPPTLFTDFQSVIDYVKTLAQNNQGFEMKSPSDLTSLTHISPNGHWFINGSVNIPHNKSLTIPSNRLLVIDGNLTLNRNSRLYGNVIVNGNVTVNGQGNSQQGIEGTIYMRGNFYTDKNLKLGTIERPTFVFAEGGVELGPQTSGYGYFLSQTFKAQQGNILITGGVYSVIAPTIQKDVAENTYLDYQLFYDYAIPTQIVVDANPDDDNTSVGFIFTTPKLG